MNPKTGLKHKWSIVVFSSGPVGKRFLEVLLKFHKKNRLNIEAVVVREDSKNPFYIEGKRDATALLAQKHGLSVMPTPDELLKESKKYDIGLSLGNFHILRREHIGLFKMGIINFHAAPILQYRGSAAPAFHILEKDTPQWGYAYHMIDEKIDEGDIIKNVIYDIPAGLSSKEIDASAIEHAVSGFSKFLDDLLNGKIKATSQSKFQEFQKLRSRKRGELYGREITDVEINDENLTRLLRAYDWPEIFKHPAIKVNGRLVRTVPENTYQEMLRIFRKFKDA